MHVTWKPGSRTVRWQADSIVEKTFADPPLAVIARSDPPCVLVIEAFDVTMADQEEVLSNAVVFDIDGTERLRLHPPILPEVMWRIGFYFAYVDDHDQLTVVYSTRAGDVQGAVDLRTGQVTDVRTWR